MSPDHVEVLLFFARQTRHPIRNQVLVLLSVKAGLRAGEIANLTWPMLAEPSGETGKSLELQDRASKKGSGRVIPIHPDLHAALVKLARLTVVLDGPVIQSERGGPMTPVSIVCWFASAYRAIGLQGCSSHSGRRTFITRAARLVHNVPVLHCETCNSWLATNQSRPLSGISTSDAASQIDEAASSSRPAESEPPPHLQAAFFSALMFSRDQFGSRFFWSRSSGTASFLVSLSNLTPLWATRHSIVAIFFVIAYREQPRAKTAENR